MNFNKVLIYKAIIHCMKEYRKYYIMTNRCHDSFNYGRITAFIETLYIIRYINYYSKENINKYIINKIEIWRKEKQ